jgi:hypothetical protein
VINDSGTLFPLLASVDLLQASETSLTLGKSAVAGDGVAVVVVEADVEVVVVGFVVGV